MQGYAFPSEYFFGYILMFSILKILFFFIATVCYG